jgi:hypothetical protein
MVVQSGVLGSQLGFACAVPAISIIIIVGNPAVSTTNTTTTVMSTFFILHDTEGKRYMDL